MTENNTAEHHSHDEHDHHEEEKTGFWLPPVQRHKWGEHQPLPHVNWGDLFYDLFYVAGAYNLSAIIKNSKNWIGLLYFFACFGPSYLNFWATKSILDSRFKLPQNDVVHRVLEVTWLCSLATAILNIRPVEDMSHPSENSETFLFCLGNLLGVFHMCLYNIEIGFIWVEGDQQASKWTSYMEFKNEFWTFLITLAATIWSRVLYNSDLDGKAHHGPMFLMLLSWLVKPFHAYYYYFIERIDNLSREEMMRNFKNYLVPINVGYLTHRYGEWTMLMLGESILSLLIVNDITEHKTYRRKYFSAFYAGILSTILLSLLFYKSQPDIPDHHATRRTRNSGFLYAWIIQLYSAALIIVGVSYKMILTEYTDEYAAKSQKEETTSSTPYHVRILAAEKDSSYYMTKEEKHSKIVGIFGLGLGFSFIFLNIMLILHNGFTSFHDRCMSSKTGHVSYFAPSLLVIGNIAVTALIMLVVFYYPLLGDYSELYVVAWLGFFAIVLQVVLRVLGDIYFPRSIIMIEEDGVSKTLTVSNP